MIGRWLHSYFFYHATITFSSFDFLLTLGVSFLIFYLLFVCLLCFDPKDFITIYLKYFDDVLFSLGFKKRYCFPGVPFVWVCFAFRCKGLSYLDRSDLATCHHCAMLSTGFVITYSPTPTLIPSTASYHSGLIQGLPKPVLPFEGSLLGWSTSNPKLCATFPLYLFLWNV